jgi:hypothetical protein
MEDFGFFIWKACMNSTTTGEWPQNSHTHSSIIYYIPLLSLPNIAFSLQLVLCIGSPET